MGRRIILVFVVVFCAHLCICAPLIKVFCAGAPLFRGRMDPLVSPGVVSGHVHRVAGASNFGPMSASATPIQVYNSLVASPCTTCSIGTADQSAYWHPDLYYEWPNGTLSLVPQGGLTIYYLARAGSGAQANPAWKAFPPGFRMMSGNPFKRTFNASSMASQAVSVACLSNPGSPQSTNLSVTEDYYCVDGLRLQVHFPQCWDGVNLDSPDHMSHVSFPIEAPDSGNCPPGFPVRIPDLFFEAFYSVSMFPHGPAPYGDGKQHFVLSCGDATGFGFHGDFISGWNQTILQEVLTDPSCDYTNTNEGNSPQNCAPVSKYVTATPADGACSVNHNIPLTENIGVSHPISTFAGCNPITGFGATAPICSSPTTSSEKAPVSIRFHLKSVLNGKFWSCPPVDTNPLLANQANSSALNYYNVFVANQYSGSLVSLQNEGPTNQFLSASGPTNMELMCNRGTPSSWEAFTIVPQSGGNVAILSDRNNMYITTNSDGSLTPTSSSIGTAQLFTQVVPSGGTAF